MVAIRSFPGRGLSITLGPTAARHPRFAHLLPLLRRGVLESRAHSLTFFRRSVSEGSASGSVRTADAITPAPAKGLRSALAAKARARSLEGIIPSPGVP